MHRFYLISHVLIDVMLFPCCWSFSVLPQIYVDIITYEDIVVFNSYFCPHLFLRNQGWYTRYRLIKKFVIIWLLNFLLGCLRHRCRFVLGFLVCSGGSKMGVFKCQSFTTCTQIVISHKIITHDRWVAFPCHRIFWEVVFLIQLRNM